MAGEDQLERASECRASRSSTAHEHAVVRALDIGSGDAGRPSWLGEPPVGWRLCSVLNASLTPGRRSSPARPVNLDTILTFARGRPAHAAPLTAHI